LAIEHPYLLPELEYLERIANPPELPSSPSSVIFDPSADSAKTYIAVRFNI
jgi:hypothetical protein